MEINDIYSLFEKHPIITTDTRNCIKNSIFFALRGGNFNGNSFAKEAISNGCAYSIVDEKQYADNDKIIYVDDCLKTLQELAKIHRNKLGVKIIKKEARLKKEYEKIIKK